MNKLKNSNPRFKETQESKINLMSKEVSTELSPKGVQFFSPSQVQHKPLYTREGIKKGHKRFTSTQNVDLAFMNQQVPQPHQERKRRHRRTQSNIGVDFNNIIGVNQGTFESETTAQYQTSQVNNNERETSPLNETQQESKTIIQDSLEAQLCDAIQNNKNVQYKEEIQSLKDNQAQLQNQYLQILSDHKKLNELNEQTINQKINENLAQIFQTAQFKNLVSQIVKEEKCQCKELTQAKVKINTLEKTLQTKDKEILKLKAQLNSLASKKSKN